MNHNVIHKLIDVNMLSNNFIDIFSYEVVKTCAKILNESMLVIRLIIIFYIVLLTFTLLRDCIKNKILIKEWLRKM